jgi:uncharacterized Fe-S cluster protein YjdI
MEKEITKKYDNGEITVVWQPHKCIHSAICFRGLPSVFDPTRRPWVTVEGAPSVEIMEQINKCPSGALSYTVNEQNDTAAEEVVSETIVEVLPNGPLLVYGNLAVKDYAGNEQKKSKVTAFCRCGSSKNKPYCDGTHAKVGFGG